MGKGPASTTCAELYTISWVKNDGMKWNLAERLRQGLPPDEWALLTAIADAAAQLGLPLYVVGGLPRDLIIGKASSDFDLVVEGRAEALAYKLAHLYGGMVTVHSRFGTAKWALQDLKIRDP